MHSVEDGMYILQRKMFRVFFTTEADAFLCDFELHTIPCITPTLLLCLRSRTSYNDNN